MLFNQSEKMGVPLIMIRPANRFGSVSAVANSDPKPNYRASF